MCIYCLLYPKFNSVGCLEFLRVKVFFALQFLKPVQFPFYMRNLTCYLFNASLVETINQLFYHYILKQYILFLYETIKPKLNSKFMNNQVFLFCLNFNEAPTVKCINFHYLKFSPLFTNFIFFLFYLLGSENNFL